MDEKPNRPTGALPQKRGIHWPSMAAYTVAIAGGVMVLTWLNPREASAAAVIGAFSRIIALSVVTYLLVGGILRFRR